MLHNKAGTVYFTESWHEAWEEILEDTLNVYVLWENMNDVFYLYLLFSEDVKCCII